MVFSLLKMCAVSSVLVPCSFPLQSSWRMRMAFCYLLFNSAPCWECVVLKFNNQLKASFLFISHTLCNLISKEASVRKKIKRIDTAMIPNIFCKVGKLFQEQIKGKKIFSNICLGWRVNVFVHSMTSLWERRQLQEQLWELLLSASCPWGWIWESLNTNMSTPVWSDQLWVPLSILGGISNIWSPFLSRWWRT